MIIKVQDQKGQVAYVDNEGQVNGSVGIKGDSPLASHLNHVLNLKIDIPFIGMNKAIDGRFKTKDTSGLSVINKASDVYMREYFIKVECPAFGYSADVLKE